MNKALDKHYKTVIHKAVKDCENAEIPSKNHFSHVGKMVKIGLGADREIEDYLLSRYT